eukprot:gene17013-18727_t
MAATGEAEAAKGAESIPEQQEATKSVKMTQEIAVKHPLHNRWALWFFKNDRSKTWAESLKLVTKFDTVEDFWGVYNHIILASKLQSGCDYSLFKDGIEPMWEDNKNRLGGRWLVNLNRNARTSDLDKIWLETLLCLVGEAFGDDADSVNGAVVNIRNKGDKIGLWTETADDQDSVMRVGKLFKERLNLAHKFTIGYQLWKCSCLNIVNLKSHHIFEEVFNSMKEELGCLQLSFEFDERRIGLSTTELKYNYFGLIILKKSFEFDERRIGLSTTELKYNYFGLIILKKSFEFDERRIGLSTTGMNYNYFTFIILEKVSHIIEELRVLDCLQLTWMMLECFWKDLRSI